MLNTTSSMVRPYAGRDPDFAEAMRRVEGAAEPKEPEPHPSDHVARTRAGHVVERSGRRFIPGSFYDRAKFEALPLTD